MMQRSRGMNDAYVYLSPGMGVCVFRITVKAILLHHLVDEPVVYCRSMMIRILSLHVTDSLHQERL